MTLASGGVLPVLPVLLACLAILISLLCFLVHILYIGAGMLEGGNKVNPQTYIYMSWTLMMLVPYTWTGIKQMGEAIISVLLLNCLTRFHCKLGTQCYVDMGLFLESQHVHQALRELHFIDHNRPDLWSNDWDMTLLVPLAHGAASRTCYMFEETQNRVGFMWLFHMLVSPCGVVHVAFSKYSEQITITTSIRELANRFLKLVASDHYAEVFETAPASRPTSLGEPLLEPTSWPVNEEV
jgi:hypothetical protein